MLKKNVTYTDYFGFEKTKTLYFDISAADMLRMFMNEADIDRDAMPEGLDPSDPEAAKYVKEGLSKRINDVVKNGRGKEILELFDWLVAAAYGEISDDGESFDQSEYLYEQWTKTAVYKKFFEALVTDTALMTEFVNGIFGDALKNETKDPEFARHREELAKRAL